jgi:hypothetical protein
VSIMDSLTHIMQRKNEKTSINTQMNVLNGETFYHHRHHHSSHEFGLTNDLFRPHDCIHPPGSLLNGRPHLFPIG